jgi:hypothetical protein
MEMEMVMQRGTRFSFIALGLALAVAPLARAEMTETTSGMPGDWLADYQGARAVGLGGAYVAAADGPLGSMWNPAGLSAMFQNQVLFETTRLFEDTSINALGFGFPGHRFPSFGFTALSLKSGAFERTSELNEPLGSFETGDTAFLFSMAKSFGPQLSLGTNLKVVNQNVEEFSATGVGVDLGLQYRVNRSLALGASLLNLGGPTMRLREADESYLTEMRGGFSIFLMDGKARLNGELDRRSGLAPTFHAGTEFWLVRSFALRFGFESAGASGGFGYRMPNGFSLDYGTADHELGLTHRIALSYNFGGFFASTNASPEVFSPTGQNSVTKFQIQSKMKGETAEWRMDIVNDSSEIVRSFGGKGVPPQHVLWDGKDATGLPLPDGIYHYQIFVRDVDGREVTSRELTVEILTSGPSGSVPISVEPK